MADKNILIEKNVIKKGNGVVVLDLDRYLAIRKKAEDYERKEKLLRNLEKFENLAKWGRNFARNKKITPRQVLEND